MSGSCRGDSDTDELVYGLSEECFSGFEVSWAWVVTDPVEIGVYGHAQGTVCVFGFVVGVGCV
jgi:hypothetical protein